MYIIYALKSLPFLDVIHSFFSFLMYTRASIGNDEAFIRGEVRVEMKKSVSYCVDVHVKDGGFIAEAQCQCTAWVGPSAHCKHVSSVICALLDFSKTRSVKREVTCTDVLQTFKRPKNVHTGSPVKACDTVKGTPAICDPRPPQNYNDPAHPDYVRNLTINYMFSPKVPSMQTIAPANMRAADLDHDYLAQCRSLEFLAQERLNAISAEEVASIEDAWWEINKKLHKSARDTLFRVNQGP